MAGKIDLVDLKVQACVSLHNFVQRRLGCSADDEAAAQALVDNERAVADARAAGDDAGGGVANIAAAVTATAWRNELALDAFNANP